MSDFFNGVSGDIPIRSVRQRVVIGVVWMVFARWTVRCVGLISTVVLARLLMPQDFGLIAMASVVIGFLEVPAFTGSGYRPNPESGCFARTLGLPAVNFGEAPDATARLLGQCPV